MTNDPGSPVIAICEGCGEPMVESILVDCVLDSHGHRRNLVYGGGGFVHLHGVTIAAVDALTVRKSLHRWGTRLWRRVIWRLNKYMAA